MVATATGGGSFLTREKTEASHQPTSPPSNPSLEPVWNCCYAGESNCSIETQRCVSRTQRVTSHKVTSAQCSECEGEEVQSSAGKRRE